MFICLCCIQVPSRPVFHLCCIWPAHHIKSCHQFIILALPSSLHQTVSLLYLLILCCFVYFLFTCPSGKQEVSVRSWTEPVLVPSSCPVSKSWSEQPECLKITTCLCCVWILHLGPKASIQTWRVDKYLKLNLDLYPNYQEEHCFSVVYLWKKITPLYKHVLLLFSVCVSIAWLLSGEWRFSGLHWRWPWAEGIPAR